MKTTLLAILAAAALAAALSSGCTPAAHADSGLMPGAAAPDFTLSDLDGKAVHLADLKGKVVVLEWFNPDCPFVRASHTKGSLVGLAKKHTAEGIIWLAIDSSAPGKQGADPAEIRAMAKQFGMDHPVLIDSDGKVGKLYGATNTPNLFVIGKDGNLAYRGAIDNSPDGEGKNATGGKLENYVDSALADLAGGKPVRTPVTKPYGCGVKYASN